MRWWFFEGLIWLFLIITGAFLVEIFFSRGWKKIKKQRRLLLVALFLVFLWGVVFYGSYIEPKILTVKNETLEIFNKPNFSLKAAVLSDFHVGPYKRAAWIKEVVAKTNAQKPDLVFLLGDYIMGVEGKTEDLMALSELQAPLGVFAVLGNHDYQNGRAGEVEAALKNFGITVLHNSSTEVTLPDASILYLAGVGDLWYDGDLEKTLNNLSSSQQVILLAHNPDAILDPAVKVTDLILSGHTHGGQIRLPFVGPLFVSASLGRYFDEGVFSVNSVLLFITSGVGEMGPRARLLNPPEVVIFQLD
ncbi:MAG: metallophosphoesterase [Candidatus Uhrbacteria bacterium]